MPSAQEKLDPLSHGRTWNQDAAPTLSEKKKAEKEHHARQPLHLVPIGDSQEHTHETPCLCRPEREGHETHTVVRHNWFDERKARIEAQRTGQEADLAPRPKPKTDGPDWARKILEREWMRRPPN